MQFILKIAVSNLVVLAVVLGTAEISARLAFPEFQGHLHSATKTLGVNRYISSFKGYLVRVPHPGYQPDARKPLFVVLGDSISNGYGMAYEDIYWVRLQRLAVMHGAGDLEFLALAAYGN